MSKLVGGDTQPEVRERRDLVERLRARRGILDMVIDREEAADRIEELESQVESLQNKWASRPLSDSDMAARIEELEAEIERLLKDRDKYYQLMLDECTKKVERQTVNIELSDEIERLREALEQLP